jgi:glycosyltransferase involved in cell wall biosynthesis
MTVLESFAAGVPVIASDLGGLPELVRDGREGLLVPHNDPQALATALTTLADDQLSAHRMGADAQLRFEAEFTAEQHLRALGDVYALARSPHSDLSGDGATQRVGRR